MSDIIAFAQLGFGHIVALDAADHILFLLALAAIYRGRDWKSVLWVITAFTVGHSVTLALAVTNVLVLPSSMVEFLIPVTIVLTGVENLIARERAASGPCARHRPIFAGVFGLVHGAGFADYLRNLFVDHLAAPLFGFNLGIEIGQVVVLGGAFAVFWLLDRAIRYQVRLVGVSTIVTVVAAMWAWDRWPS